MNIYLPALDIVYFPTKSNQISEFLRTFAPLQNNRWTKSGCSEIVSGYIRKDV